MKRIFTIVVMLALLFSSMCVSAQQQGEMTQEEMIAAMTSDPEMQAFLNENPEMMATLENAKTAEEMRTLMFQYGLEQMKDEFNSNRGEVPEIVISLFGNEKINIYLDEQLVAGIAMEEGYIQEINPNGLEKPTVNLYISEEFMTELSDGEANFSEALASKDLQYKGVGFFNKLKFGTLKLFSSMLF